jgi:hypothetical protein
MANASRYNSGREARREKKSGAANPDHAFRQDVKEETSQELRCSERHPPLLTPRSLSIGRSRVRHQRPAIGDWNGDAMGKSPQVTQDLHGTGAPDTRPIEGKRDAREETAGVLPLHCGSPDCRRKFFDQSPWYSRLVPPFQERLPPDFNSPRPRSSPGSTLRTARPRWTGPADRNSGLPPDRAE